MSWLADLARGITRGIIESLRSKPAPPWRHGHSFLPDSTQCIYCRWYIPGRYRVTTPPCNGPDHKLTPTELGR